MRTLPAAVAAAALLAGGAGCHRGEKEITVALVPKAMDSEFWLAVADGARAAAAARPGVHLSIVAPDREINIDQQVSILEDQTRRGVSALVVAPAGSAQVMSALEQAAARKIPVVVIDSDAPFDRKVSYVGTDNRKGGALAARRRIEALAAAPGMKLVAQQPANSERVLGLTVMENILTAHPDLKGVFATNDQMALGAMEALDARGLRGKIAIVGFDATKEAVQATVEGRLAGSVAQNPRAMGQRGVEAALAALDGRPVDKRIDTGTEMVTAENAAKYLK